MKVVFLSRLFYPHIGGVEKHVMEVSRELIKKGHEVTVITERLDILDSRFHGNDRTKENIDGIIVYRIPVGGEDWFKKFRVWREMWQLRKVWQDVDIIHAHDAFFWYLPFRFFYNKKIFTTFHGF